MGAVHGLCTAPMGLRSDVLSSCSQTSQEAQPGRPVARGKGTHGTMKIILKRAEP